MEVTDTITMIPIAQIVESPFNPRRTFGDSGLQELATDIKLHGILSPLLTRARLVDPLASVDKMFDGFELVFGHRRFRAAQLAGLQAVPCMVRKMSDEEARRAQISENLAREDVHPIEEAEGLQALIDAGDTADQLAEQFGKSRSYIYARLKLLMACPAIRNACLAGELNSEVALRIARLRTDKLQEKALGYIKGKFINLGDGGNASVRQLTDLLNERFMLDLPKAIFDISDPLLVPEAGTCAACPKRSGNAPEFEDVVLKGKQERWSNQHGGADVCTDPDCFGAKKAAHLRNAAAALEKKGKHVVTGNAARAAIDASGNVKGNYIALKDARKEVDTARMNAQGNSKIVPPLIVTIQDPRTGKTVEAVKTSELKAAGIKLSATKDTGNPEAARQAREAATAKQEVKMRAERAARVNLLRTVCDAMLRTDRSAFDMTMITKSIASCIDHDSEGEVIAELWGALDFRELEEKVDTMTVDEQLQLLFQCALAPGCDVTPWSLDTKPAELLKAAAYYGVDVAAARGDEPAQPASTPSTAARAAKGASGKAEKKTKTAGSAGAGVDLIGDATGSNQSVEAGSAGEEAKDEPAHAGVERDPNTSDMFERTQA